MIMELIDISTLIAELERRITAYQKNFDKADNKLARLSTDGRMQSLKELLSFLDTLEVKEVEEEPSDDLEQEIENELERTWCGEYLDTDKFRESAKHFFELGLKAQKGE